MNWLALRYFFAGVFAANGVPHFVAGMLGRRFPTPFAKPPGRGLSSSVVNVAWGFFNEVVAYLLVARDQMAGWRGGGGAVAFGGGALLLSVSLAYYFGKMRAGDAHEDEPTGTMRK